MNDNTVSAVIGASAGVLVAAIGWFVTSHLSLRRQRQTQRFEYGLRHVRAQIQELYGPLLALLHRSRTVYELAKKRIGEKGGRLDLSDSDPAIWKFFAQEHFLPILREIARLVSSRMHLLASASVPESIEQFFRHFAQFDCLHGLSEVAGVTSWQIDEHRFPVGLEDEVRSTLHRLRAQYAEYLGHIGPEVAQIYVAS